MIGMFYNFFLCLDVSFSFFSICSDAEVEHLLEESLHDPSLEEMDEHKEKIINHLSSEHPPSQQELDARYVFVMLTLVSLQIII